MVRTVTQHTPEAAIVTRDEATAQKLQTGGEVSEATTVTIPI